MGKKKDYGLDQFYTDLNIAKQCIDSIDITKYDVVIEPSAGAGAFYNQINHKYKMGFDLEPKCDGVHLWERVFGMPTGGEGGWREVAVNSP